MAGDIEFDLRQIDDLRKDFKKFAKVTIPLATRDALNAAAFAARKTWKGEMERTFTIRNKFTTNSIKVVKARGRNIDTMQAVIGTPLDYLARREDGATERGKSGNLPIPTRVAAGQGKGMGTRTKAVRRPNTMAAINVGRRARFGTRKQRNAIAISRAVRGTKFAVIETKRGDAIVKVTGRKRVKLRMVWNLFNKTVSVPRKPTLKRTMDTVDSGMPRHFVRAIDAHLARQRLFR